MLHSLRARLALWLLLPLAVLVGLCGWFAHEHAEDAADYVQDHDLLSSAKILADRLIWEDGDVRASVPPSALSLFMSPARDHVYLSVMDAQGQLLAGQQNFPQPPKLQLSGSDNAQWYDAVWQGQPIRAVITRRAMYDVAGAREITILVGKTTHSRDNMVQTLWWPTMEYLLWALAVAVLVSATALTLELRALLRMARQLAERPARDLDFHLDSRQIHQELRPLTDTVNQFARTIRAQVARQRQFISDAAHQLRTPLAIQAHTLEQALGQTPAELAALSVAQRLAVLQRLQRSNQQLLNVANQLLTLAQAEAGGAAQTPQWLDLRALCLQCLEALAPAADLKQIDLGWEERAAPAAAPADGAMPSADAHAFSLYTSSRLLPELIANLVDNAIRYTPPQGQVTLGLEASAGSLLLWVQDNGPGIPAQSRDRVLERFYRLANDTPGTGLGLAIVQEVARATGASLQLADAQQRYTPPFGPGLRISVRFVRAVGEH
ncbi:sensor histidine kinase [Comamonas sp. B-9]|uniref:sensor histidine kinase n=1 Tax=Comamonas sp. B-9 TaxID=1055192 RepID=UPI0003959500|nr:sensor histidine kinase [Comamonas sp. B-9]